jgi:tetraprenyl-beta-curcumene synthase
LRAVSSEVARWRELAKAIPDPRLREDALHALERKRANIDGAAFFWTLPRSRSPRLLRLLVAYECLADYLDCAHERAADAGVQNGLQLHRALVDAIHPTVPTGDYYRLHPWRDDGGYLAALVECCRENVAQLPAFEQVRPFALRAARLAQVLAINHEPDGDRRDQALAAWAALHFPDQGELAWFEWTAAASAWLTVLALLALAADEGARAAEAAATFDAYLPWVSLAGTMLDSLSDAAEDRESGAHSYIAHYPTPSEAIRRVGEITSRALTGLRGLPGAERHLVLASCMVAMYLSKDGKDGQRHLGAARLIAERAGPLTRALIPVLRAWRVLYGQQSDGAPAARRRLPPSAPLPVVAQTFAFWAHPYRYLAWCRRRYGPTFTIKAVGMAPLVFVSTSQDIKAIVRAPAHVLHPGAGAAVIAPLVGEGSFMLAEEEAHITGRRAVLPAFHHSRVREHAEAIGETVRREVASWPRDRPFPIHPRLRKLSLHVILQAVFGDADPTRIGLLHKRLLAMLAVTGSLALQERHLRGLPPWRRIWRAFLEERDAVYGMLDGLIEQKAHHAGDGGLLGMLLDSPTGNDPVQVREDLMSVLLAGHETTASELAWAFQLLAHDRQVARRLAETLDAGDDGYLTATVQEVLRHRPVFMFTIPRVVNAPFRLGERTYHPPEQLVGCIHLMQHDPAVFENPDRFLPDRFLAADPPSDVWMPWGGGRKRCPGHHLAVLEMQIVLKTVFSALEVLPAAGTMETASWRSVIVTPARGSRVVLRSRSRGAGAQLGPPPPFFRRLK